MGERKWLTTAPLATRVDNECCDTPLLKEDVGSFNEI